MDCCCFSVVEAFGVKGNYTAYGLHGILMWYLYKYMSCWWLCKRLSAVNDVIVHFIVEQHHQELNANWCNYFSQ